MAASSCSCSYEEDTSGGEPSVNKPLAPARQESDDSEEEEESESDEAPPEPRTQPKEMSVFRLRIKKGLLNCTYCRRPLRPDTYNGRAYTCRQCVRRQIYCRECIRCHHFLAADTHSACNLLNHIIAQMKFKCDCNKYIPYCEFVEHRRECPSAKYSTPPARWKCMLKASVLRCSECEVPIRPPVFFSRSSNNLICSACYRADISTYRHCTELEYLLQGIKVKCIPCKQYFPFSWLGSRRVGDCPFKRELQNIAPGSSGRKKLCDEEENERPMAGNNSIHGKNKRKVHFEVGKMDKHIFHGDEVASDDDSYDASYDDNHPESVKRVAENAFKTPSCDKKAKTATPYGQKTDEYESTRPPAGNNSTIIGNTKGKARSKVRKMDNHIVDSDVVESDDDLSDDIHPESGIRVAENAFKTPACNKKVNIAMPYGQKTAPTHHGASRRQHLPITAPSKPPLPRRPGTRLFESARNRNRA
ncbi:hypothetical protein PAHAL_7G005400 [Panicum hallii]|uniref:Uncharacterized protein n=2 Tax=Panicum hallii TaxID=206008 RepID=A0A2T8IAH0_9POAL|nr:hypothetical protein PAHAL_7G005400 [Panicum hallii]PVH34677.1 hypothetical protein PAHAL_7G005400 [Panicum hallii]